MGKPATSSVNRQRNLHYSDSESSSTSLESLPDHPFEHRQFTPPDQQARGTVAGYGRYIEDDSVFEVLSLSPLNLPAPSLPLLPRSHLVPSSLAGNQARPSFDSENDSDDSLEYVDVANPIDSPVPTCFNGHPLRGRRGIQRFEYDEPVHPFGGEGSTGTVRMNRKDPSLADWDILFDYHMSEQDSRLVRRIHESYIFEMHHPYLAPMISTYHSLTQAHSTGSIMVMATAIHGNVRQLRGQAQNTYTTYRPVVETRLTRAVALGRLAVNWGIVEARVARAGLEEMWEEAGPWLNRVSDAARKMRNPQT